MTPIFGSNPVTLSSWHYY